MLNLNKKIGVAYEDGSIYNAKGELIVSRDYLTKYDKFAMLLQIDEVSNNPLLSNFIVHELALIERKAEKQATTEKKPTKKQLEQQEKNNVLLQEISNFIEEMQNTAVTIDDLQEQIESLQGLQKQKIAFLMKKLVDAGKVERDKNGNGRVIYSPKTTEE